MGLQKNSYRAKFCIIQNEQNPLQKHQKALKQICLQLTRFIYGYVGTARSLIAVRLWSSRCADRALLLTARCEYSATGNQDVDNGRVATQCLLLAVCIA